MRSAYRDGDSGPLSFFGSRYCPSIPAPDLHTTCRMNDRGQLQLANGPLRPVSRTKVLGSSADVRPENASALNMAIIDSPGLFRNDSGLLRSHFTKLQPDFSTVRFRPDRSLIDCQGGIGCLSASRTAPAWYRRT